MSQKFMFFYIIKGSESLSPKLKNVEKKKYSDSMQPIQNVLGGPCERLEGIIAVSWLPI